MPEPPRYMDALRSALSDEMERDDRVVVLGIDVGEGGGVYGITRGLLERFPGRILDTPIAEAGVVGTAVGAAITGLRPVVEIMYMDFLTVCLDPIVNQAAKLRYMTGGNMTIPVVFRMQTGAGQSAGAQHSQSLEAILAHIPGLLVYYPSDERDAYDFLVAAIRNDNPVCFVENRRLYPKVMPDCWNREPLPPGTARLVRSGRQITVVTWGLMVHETMGALDGTDIDADVIDLRTLVPLDMETVLESVRRTHRCLVVHDAVQAFGPGAEVCSRIAEEALYDLDGPVRRFGALPSPMPYSRDLEREVLPQQASILEHVRAVLRG